MNIVFLRTFDTTNLQSRRLLGPLQIRAHASRIRACDCVVPVGDSTIDRVSVRVPLLALHCINVKNMFEHDVFEQLFELRSGARSLFSYEGTPD